MNVLVYSGPEVAPLSLTHALTSLRSVLFPHFTVQPISQSALLTQPWKASCTLLVLPQIKTSEHGFVSTASRHIREYVETGGKFMVFGAGASVRPRLGFGSSLTGLTVGLEEAQPLALPLTFFDNTIKRYVTFDLSEDNLEETKQEGSPIIVSLVSEDDGTVLKHVYKTNSRKLVGFEGLGSVSILARHVADNENLVSCLVMKIDNGILALLNPNIEHPLNQGPVSSLLSSVDVESSEASRRRFLRGVLRNLGLDLPDNDTGMPAVGSRPLPQFLICTPHHSTIVSKIVDTLSKSQSLSLTGENSKVLKDAEDTFHFHPFHSEERVELLALSGRAETKDLGEISNWQPKHILVCEDGMLPERQMTPLFNFELYFEALRRAREQEGLKDREEEEEGSWGIGEALLYGEVVTSTQTMLAKNPVLLSNLPTPLLSLASHQLAGRGRGSNIWLSPSGCLQFSLLLRISLSPTPTTPPFPAVKLVFIQYLAALAISEACRDENVLGEKLGSKVRLKWPNDLYVDLGVDGKEDLKKFGGILVNTNFQGGKVDIVIGCGLNILNQPPIASLVQLQQLHSHDLAASRTLILERIAAVIMIRFEVMWNTFVRERSFEPFMSLYLKRWLHSDQLVTLTTTDSPTRVRIIGITTDHGLLRTVREGSAFEPGARWQPEYIDLQPDGNSFDLMARLIRVKT